VQSSKNGGRIFEKKLSPLRLNQIALLELGYTEAEILAKSSGEVGAILKARVELNKLREEKPSTTSKIKRRKKKSKS
jgi:hypothetical protein